MNCGAEEKTQLLNKSIFEGLPEVRPGLRRFIESGIHDRKRFSAQGIPVTLPREEK
jgi:hypothetical protein